MPHWELIIFFFAIALIYASVGFGGGSSYLAILALYGFPQKEMKLIALVCNIIVVTGGCYIFIRNKQVVWKKVWPLLLAGAPMAWFGAAKLRLEERTFFIVLGCTLIVSAFFLWIKTNNKVAGEHAAPSVPRDAALGAVPGFIAGITGIGGGIFLSPVLNLLKWDEPKKIAATASLFILVNSVSGIIGQLSTGVGPIDYRQLLILGAAVLVGGQIGSRLVAFKFDQLMVRRLTAVLVLVAGFEVLNKQLHLTDWVWK